MLVGQIAREAGVSRGLLHYYFGTKERLLVEVARRDTELRVTRLDERLGEHQVRFAILRRLGDRDLARGDRGVPVAVVHGEARAIAGMQ